MNDRAIINAGPLIAFSRANVLDVLQELPIKFVAPPEVVDEIAAGAASGHSIAWPE